MKGTILLNYQDNTHQVEDEEKTRFLRALLDQMGVPVAEFWTNETSLSVTEKMKLRGVLSSYGVQVLDDLDGHMQVYVEGELVGEWNKCTYKLKKDLREIDPRKRLYLEMQIDCWSLFDEAETQEI